LCSGRLKLAQKLCDELGVLASPVTGVDMEIKTEASLRHARTLLAAKQFREVFSHPFCMQYVRKISIIPKIMIFLKV
jgi:anaphase-promoting complex subunit 5